METFLREQHAQLALSLMGPRSSAVVANTHSTPSGHHVMLHPASSLNHPNALRFQPGSFPLKALVVGACALANGVAGAQSPAFERVYQSGVAPQDIEGRAIVPVTVAPQPGKAFLMASSPVPGGSAGSARFQYLDSDGTPVGSAGRHWRLDSGPASYFDVQSMVECPTGGFLVAGAAGPTLNGDRPCVVLLDAALNIVASRLPIPGLTPTTLVKAIPLPGGQVVHMFPRSVDDQPSVRPALDFYLPGLSNSYKSLTYTTNTCDRLEFNDILEFADRLYVVGTLHDSPTPGAQTAFLMSLDADSFSMATHGTPLKMWLFPDNQDGFTSSVFTSVTLQSNGPIRMSGYSTKADGTSRLRVVAFDVFSNPNGAKVVSVPPSFQLPTSRARQ